MTAMTIVFFASIFLVLLGSGVALRTKNDILQLAGWVMVGVVTIFGLVVLPLVVPDSVEYDEITNVQILKTEEAIIIDLVNSPEKGYYDLYKFDRYRSVVEINDSTKFFFKLEKSFYGATVYENPCWSNPPYETYNVK